MERSKERLDKENERRASFKGKKMQKRDEQSATAKPIKEKQGTHETDL